MHCQAMYLLLWPLVPPPLADSVPEHGVLVDLPQRVGDLHGLAVPRMRMHAKGLLLCFLLLSCHDPGEEFN